MTYILTIILHLNSQPYILTQNYPTLLQCNQAKTNFLKSHKPQNSNFSIEATCK